MAMGLNHKGENNPFFGHFHKEGSKQKISSTQKLRYKRLYEILNERKLTERIRRIVREELNNSTPQ